jgi:hypothetical protein
LCVSPPWGFRAVFPSLISILLDLFAFPFAFPFFGFCTFYIPAESDLTLRVLQDSLRKYGQTGEDRLHGVHDALNWLDPK